VIAGGKAHPQEGQVQETSRSRPTAVQDSPVTPRPLLGAPAHLAVLTGALLMVVLTPPEQIWLAAALPLAAAGLLYPASYKRLFQPRWLLLLGFLPVLHTLAGERDLLLLNTLAVSTSGFWMGLAMAVRAAVVLLVVDGFSGSVNISEVAGLLERTGLKGLGFSVGIAFNLLPILRQSSLNTWHSLRMRGGIRRRRLQALKYYFVTVVSSAIQRAEDIALAAEARAFSPEKARPLPVKWGAWDWGLIMGVGAVLLLLLLGR
jgi:energy-coupling factor transporter transmembrane protein EcfT